MKILSRNHSSPATTAKYIAAADHAEEVDVVIILRRRVGHDRLPQHREFKVGSPHPRLSTAEYGRKHGAHMAELHAVKDYCASHGITVKQIHQARRQVVLRGTVAQFTAAFQTTVHTWEKTTEHHGTYRFLKNEALSIPDELHPYVTHIYGLDTEHRRIRSAITVPQIPSGVTPPVSPSAVKSYYQSLTNSAAGQFIGIAGEADNDIDIAANMQYYGMTMPPSGRFVRISVDGSNRTTLAGNGQGEGVMDIVLSLAFGPGATAVIYYCAILSLAGSALVIGRMCHPDPGDPVLDIQTHSYIYGATLDRNPGTALDVFETYFQDAATQGMTCLFSSGDKGSTANATDGTIGVGWPACSPWTTACGGTALNPTTGVEYAWNDSQGGVLNGYGGGASGGGISEHFPKPSYQDDLPLSLSPYNQFPGCANPDIAGLASGNTYLPLVITQGAQTIGAAGTSATAPMYAGMIAQFNAARGQNLGFLNPLLYSLGSGVLYLGHTASPGSNFVDSHGQTWAVTTGGAITVNGAAQSGISGVTYLLYYIPTDQIYRLSNAGWFQTTASGGLTAAYTATANPLPSLAPIRDITSAGTNAAQDNIFAPATTGYNVLTGYDCVTGLGSLNMQKLYDVVSYLDSTSTPIPSPPPTPPISSPTGTYYFEVQASNSIGVGPLSAVYGPVNAVVPAPPPPPPAPPPPIIPPPPPPPTPPPSSGVGPVVAGSYLNVDFGATTGQTIDAGLWGVCWGAPDDNGFAALADAGFRSAAQSLPFTFHRLNPDGGQYTEAVFGSGTTANWSFFNNFFTYGPQVIPAGSRIIMGIGSNVTRWSVSSYANIVGQFVNKMRQSFSMPIWGYEIGNESEGDGSKGLDFNTYNAYYNAAGAVIRGIDPSLKIIGPVPNYFNDGAIQSWLAACRQYADVTCYHDYYGCIPVAQGGSAPTNQQAMVYTSQFADHVRTAHQYNQAQGISDPIIFNGEWNKDGCTLDDNPTDYTGAVFGANYLISMANGGSNNTLAAVWEYYQDTTFGLIGSSTLGGYNISPLGYMLSKANHTMFGSRVQSTNISGSLTSLTVVSGNRVGVMLVNSGGSSTGQVALSRMPGTTTGNLSLNKWVISQANPSGSTTTQAVVGGLANITLPQYSVTILYS